MLVSFNKLLRKEYRGETRAAAVVRPGDERRDYVLIADGRQGSTYSLRIPRPTLQFSPMHIRDYEFLGWILKNFLRSNVVMTAEVE